MKVFFSLLMVLVVVNAALAQAPRGFEPGQTLPDISLIDLEGKEVRFSDFLGKQYVLYGWASW